VTDRDALLAAIVANPDEDTPRLMYADEVEAFDPERAAAIRHQVAFRGGTAGWIADVLTPGERGWLPDGLPLSGMIFTRGFVSEARCPWGPWRDHGDDLLRCNPVTKVTLTTPVSWEEKTAVDISAPPGWACGYVIAGVGFRWETLGRPDIDPTDHAALTLALLRARWPSVREWEVSADDVGAIARRIHDNHARFRQLVPARTRSPRAT
jgi:uncharacterized protein (TIGR02996 family)